MTVPTPGEFRADAERFLRDHAAPRAEPVSGDRAGGRVALFRDADPEHERAEVRAAREWRATVFDAGFGWISGPVELGGRGLPRAYERAYFELERGFVTPGHGYFGIGLGMVAPTILDHGSAFLQTRYLRALHRADVVACQLFSEPGAGSDLASVGTRAHFDETAAAWSVEGQKVWTSGAHYSDLGLLLARTRAEPRHRNLTAFLVRMDTPGVSVRPLRQMTGGASFNEVFFDRARIPDDHRVGDVGAGWSVAVTTLLHERGAVGGVGVGGSGIFSLDRYTAMAHRHDLATDPVTRQALADLHAHLSVARWTRSRAEAAHRAGRPPGPEMSIAKLALTDNLARISKLVTELLGPGLVAESGETEMYAWAELVLGVPGMRLGGGTDEIQRNIIAERVLGLPRG